MRKIPALLLPCHDDPLTIRRNFFKETFLIRNISRVPALIGHVCRVIDGLIHDGMASRRVGRVERKGTG